MLLQHPEIPSCSDCQKWLYQPSKGWQIATAGGKHLPRPSVSHPPCHRCPKSLDKATPNPAAELRLKNLQAYELYLEIQAGAPMPDDAIVRRNCRLIKMVEQSIERGKDSGSDAMLSLFAAVFGMGAKK